MKILGIDPGLKGAYAIIDDKNVTYDKLPILDEHIDILFFYNIIQSIKPDVVFMEKIHAVPLWGKKQCFSFGHTLGFIEAAIRFSNHPFVLINPQAWQKLMFVGADAKLKPKEKAFQVIHRLYPNLKFNKKDDGVIDAVLIAEYGRRTYAE